MKDHLNKHRKYVIETGIGLYCTFCHIRVNIISTPLYYPKYIKFLKNEKKK